MSEGEENSVKKITVTVKTPKEKQTVEIHENASISEVSLNLYIFLTYLNSKTMCICQLNILIHLIIKNFRHNCYSFLRLCNYFS